MTPHWLLHGLWFAFGGLMGAVILGWWTVYRDEKSFNDAQRETAVWRSLAIQLQRERDTRAKVCRRAMNSVVGMVHSPASPGSVEELMPRIVEEEE